MHSHQARARRLVPLFTAALITLTCSACESFFVAVDNRSPELITVRRFPPPDAGDPVLPGHQYMEFGPGDGLYPGHYVISRATSGEILYDGRECQQSNYFVVSPEFAVSCAARDKVH